MKILIIICAMLVICGIFFTPESAADTVYLKSGFHIECMVKNETDEVVEVSVDGGMMRFPKEQIDKIEISSESERQALYSRWKKEKKSAAEKDASDKEKVKRSDSPQPAKIDPESGHITVTALINEKINANLLLDTGSTAVVLSSDIARKLKIDVSKEERVVKLQLGDGRKTEAKYVVLKSVSVQGMKLENVDAAILPVNSPTPANFKDGLLGMSFLKKFSFKVDTKNNKLILEKLN